MRKCPDCGVEPTALHIAGCDVERCCLCGGQAISCHCVYAINGMNIDRLEFEQPDIWGNGPTKEMVAKMEVEEAKCGGRLPWTGEWPDLEACRRYDLWCYWGDRTTGEPIEVFDPKRPGKWIECKKDHPAAREDLNRLSLVAVWDKQKRSWVALS